MSILEEYKKAADGLKEAHRAAAEADARFGRLLAPKASDLGLIGGIHEWYRRTAAERSFRADGTANNKQFVFLVLYLYSPASLVGGRINKGLRRAIAAALGISAATAVYKMRSVAVSWYGMYPRFREEVDTVVASVPAEFSGAD